MATQKARPGQHPPSLPPSLLSSKIDMTLNGWFELDEYPRYRMRTIIMLEVFLTSYSALRRLLQLGRSHSDCPVFRGDEGEKERESKMKQMFWLAAPGLILWSGSFQSHVETIGLVFRLSSLSLILGAGTPELPFDRPDIFDWFLS